MANNKFIERLKGQPTAGSLVEIKNTSAKTSFANMPNGTSNANDVYSDHRGNATIVANGTLLWKVDGKTLESVESVYGDGKDFSGVQSVAGSGLWVNASYTFPSTGDPNHPVAMVFNPNTKWVLKLCGDNLIVDGGNVVDFTLIVKIGSANIFSKNFKIAENAGQFSKEFILDFEETNTRIVKAGGLAKLTLQLLCGTENASARIYNGMTVLTCLQRKVDAYAVSSTNANVQDVLDGNIVPDDYFSNPKFIDQIEDGKDAYAVFNRDGDSVILSGWTPKEDVATAAQLNTEIQNRISADDALGLRIDNEATARESADNALGVRIDNVINDLATETTARENADTALQGQITSNKNAIDAHVADTANPHNVTKAQVGLGNVDNTSDLDKPISTATQAALDLKADKSTTYTKTETDTLLGAKQDTISDLSTIRSNAQSGKSASDTIATYGNIVTHNVSEFATATQGAKADTAVQPGDLATVATSGSYNDLGDKPTIGNAVLTIARNNESAGSFSANATENQTINIAVPVSAGDVNALPDTTKYGASVSLIMDSTTYKVSASLKDQNGDVLGAVQTIDLPLESVVVSGTYDAATKEVVLTLQDGSKIRFSVADLVDGLQTEITESNKLSADLVDDSTTVNKFVTSSEKATWNGKQDAISDLATIRSNASAGKSASDTIATYGNIVTHNVSEFATAAQGAKADTAVQPSDVGNGTITITQGGTTKGAFTTNQSNDTTIELDAGGSGSSGYRPDLFDYKWADHQLNDVSWLRADTFSWQSGDVYVAAYQHLTSDYESATTGYRWKGDTTGNIYTTKGMPSVGDTVVGGGYTVGEVGSNYIVVYKNGAPYETATLDSAVSGLNTSQTETIGGITITYYLSEDGHKICLPDQESNLVALYNATGVAWYYILDTTNRQFKLPRTKWGFTGLRDSVGGYVEPGLPDHNHQIIINTKWGSQSASDGPNWCGDDATRATNIAATSTNASQSNSIYGNSDTVQPRATQMYLYFYVGNFEQSAIEQTAGLNAEMFNGKADRNLLNTTDNVDIVIESQFPTAENGYTWYRKYKSGWVEQGGIKLQNTDSKQDLSLPIEMNGPTYSVLTSVMDDNLSNFVFCVKVTDKTTTGFKTTIWGSYQQGISTSGYNFVWQVSGMSA